VMPKLRPNKAAALLLVLWCLVTAPLHSQTHVVSPPVELLWPLPDDAGRIVRTVGPGIDPETGLVTIGHELELSVLVGTPVSCLLPGKVVVAAWDVAGGSLGYVIAVDHSGDVITVVSRLQYIDVSEGDKIDVGDRIGAAGASDDLEGGLVRLQAWVGGSLVDPIPLLYNHMPARVREQYDADAVVWQRRIQEWMPE